MAQRRNSEDQSDSQALGENSPALSIDDLRALALEAGYENDVLDSFCDRMLSSFIEKSEKKGMTAPEMIDRLKLAVDTYKSEVPKLEAGMDMDLFKELAIGEHVVRGGIERDSKRKITWINLQGLAKGSWMYKRNSPQWYSFLRAFLFVMEGSTAACWSTGEEEPSGAQYMLWEECGMFDFNAGLMEELGKLAYTIFPANSDIVRNFGLSAASQVGLNVWKMIAGKNSENMIAMQSRDFRSLATLVTNENDIPQYWLASQNECPILGKPFSSQDPRNRWLIDRVVNGEQLSLKDSHNPGPLLFHEMHYSSIAGESLDRRDTCARKLPLTHDNMDQSSKQSRNAIES